MVAAVVSGVGAAVIVGSATAASATLTHYPMLAGQAARYAVAALILLAVMRWRREAATPRRLSRGELARLVALAATGLAGFNICLIAALRHASPAAVGAVVGAAPVILALGGPLLARRRPSWRPLAAAIVVVAGAGITQGLGGGRPIGLLLALGALAGEVGFSLLAVPLLPTLGPTRLSAYLTAIAAVGLAAGALVTGGPSAFALPNAGQIAALGYLAVVVTAGAFLLWYFCLARLGPERGGLLLGGIPVSAALTAPLFHTGSLTLGALVGTALVGGGVCLGLRPQPAPVTAAISDAAGSGCPRSTASCPGQAARRGGSPPDRADPPAASHSPEQAPLPG